MNAQDKLELFRESLYAISDEDFLTLFEEIDSQTQEGQLSMEEYFDEINNKDILMCEKIKNTPLMKDYNFTLTSLEVNFDLEKEILTAA